MQAEIISKSLPQLLTDNFFERLNTSLSVGINGIINWPIGQQILLTLYCLSVEHSRSIQTKSEGAFGGGLTGDGAERVESLCETGAADLFTGLAIDLECYGNAFLELVRDGRGQLIGLANLPALTMYRHVDLETFVQITYDSNGSQVITQFEPETVIMVRTLCPMGGYYSLPSWISCEPLLELANAAIQFNQKFFVNSAIPEHAIISKGTPLTDTQKNVVKDFFDRQFKGIDNARKTLYLHIGDTDSTIEFRQLTQNRDGDFLRLLDAVRDRVPIAHGVPPRMLGIVVAGQLGGGGELTGQLFSFEKLTLEPLRRRVFDQLRPLWKELEIDLKTLKFKGIDLTPPDMDNQNITGWAQSGIITPEEARTLLQIGEEPGILSKAESDVLVNLLKRL